MKGYKKANLIIFSCILIVITLLIGASFGSSNITILDVFSIMLNKLFKLPLREGITEQQVAIIWVIRLPRVFLAFVVGAMLAVSGAITQSILKNPLASPYTIGVSAGASLGVAIYVIFGVTISIVGTFTLPIVGFISSIITIFLVIKFSSKVDGNLSNNTVILMGMVISLFASAMLTTLMAIFNEDLKSIVNWQMGSFALKGWNYLLAAIPFMVIGLLILSKYLKEMDALTFGDDFASSLGIEVPRVKKILLTVVAILTGTAVALSGVIGFVDLIIPQITRRIFGAKHSIIIPSSFILGGLFMVIADLVARTIISPSELPIGAITSLIGAPFFAYIYFKKGKKV